MLYGSLSPCRLGVHPATVRLGQRLLHLLFCESGKVGNTFEYTEKSKTADGYKCTATMRLAGTVFVSVHELFKSIILFYLRLVRKGKLFSYLS